MSLNFIDIDTLIHDYLNETISDANWDRLKRMISLDQKNMDRFVELVDLERLLTFGCVPKPTSDWIREGGVSQKMEAITEETIRSSVSGRMSPISLNRGTGVASAQVTALPKPSSLFSKFSVAAGLFLAVACGWLWMKQNPQIQTSSEGQMTGDLVATVGQTQAAFVIRDGVRSALQSGEKVMSGDTLLTEAEGQVVLNYQVGARLVMGASSELNLSRDTNNLLTHLRHGVLRAGVKKQQKNNPFLIQTPEALVQVVGTNFSVESLSFDIKKEGEGLLTTSATRLRVRDGLVKVKNLFDSNEITVSAGYLAMVADGFFLEAVEDMGGGDYKRGSVVFESNFDKDLSDWDLWIGSDRENLQQVPFSEDRVLLESNEEDVMKWAKECVSVQSPGVSSEKRDLFSALQMKETMKSDAFEVEALMVLRGKDLFIDVPFKNVKVLEGKYLVGDEKNELRRGLHIRWECVSLGIQENGKERFDVCMTMRHSKNLRTGSVGSLIRIYKTRVEVDDRRLAFVTMKGRSFKIRQLIVREMVKKSVWVSSHSQELP